MARKIFILFALGFFLVSCAGMPTNGPSEKRQPQEVVVKVQACSPPARSV